MQNSERQPFDNSWQKAFDGAEMAPPDRLWSSIEGELAGGETAIMKKRVVFYQRLAAATVLFALMTGAYAIYNNRSTSADVATSTQKQDVPAVAKTEPPREVAETVIPKASASENSTNSLRAEGASPRVSSSKGKTSNSQTTGNTTDVPPTVVLLAESNSNAVEKQDRTAGFDEVREPETAVALNERSQETIETINQIPGEEKAEEVKILSADEINAIAEAEAKKKDVDLQRAPWLGVGAAAGSFSPSAVMAGGGFAEADPAFDYATQQPNTPQSHSANVGSAYSAGVSAGLRVSRRWILQSGLNYINQRVDYTTNFVGVSASNQASAMTKDYMSGSTSMYTAVVNPYEVSSATEILSIPVQAGYMIVDRKLGWQINSGVSTDFMLQNTLTDKSGLRNRVTEGAGEDSPFRAVNWAAMLNTEVSYQIGNHYRLALVPGMRYSFQPMLKGSNSGTPLILDVGFRFKYLFN